MKPTYEELEKKLAVTEQKLAVTEQKLAETEEKLAKTEDLLKQALDRILKLEEQINKNSNNSSKPPSTDQKSNKPNKSRKSNDTRKGINRQLYPPERVDKRIECSLENCPHCNSQNLNLWSNVEILQQVDLPEVRATVTEYILQKFHCADCRKNSKADLPCGIPFSAFGPRVMALLTTLTGGYLMPKRDACQLIQDLYAIDIGLGSVPNIEERVAEALSVVSERIHQYILDSKLCKHLDETGWRDSGKRHYAWIVCNTEATAVKIFQSRSSESFEKLVKNCKKFNAVTDRYAAYNSIEGSHQYCLAHLIRDFQKYAERDGPDREVGEQIVSILKKACKIHAEYRQEKRTLKKRNQALGQMKRKLKNCLNDGFLEGSSELSGLCDRIYENLAKIWAFTNIEGMEPTNNLAERNIRNLVIRRKRSYGTRSSRGKTFIERITSIVVTLKQQKVNIYKFFTDAISKFYKNLPSPMIAPSLGF